MKLYTDFPIELGQEYRYKTVANFKKILDAFKDADKRFELHKTEDKHAHNANQIDYKLSNVHDELQYQDGRIEGLVIGHNGDGIEELKDSRTSLDGTNHELLSARLKHDYQVINKKIEDNYEYLNN